MKYGEYILDLMIAMIFGLGAYLIGGFGGFYLIGILLLGSAIYKERYKEKVKSRYDESEDEE